MYDLIIIGGGPAGVSAGVYAARKLLNTLLITENIGGQSTVSASIENWIGTKEISGFDLSKNLEAHIAKYPEVKISVPELVSGVKKDNGIFTVETSKGNSYHALSMVVASGASKRKLNVPGEEKYEGKGVVYCSTCDAPLFRNKDVIIVGSGNSALSACLDLTKYAKKIYLLVRGNVIKGDPSLLEDVKKHENTQILFNSVSREIIGEGFVTAIKYIDNQTNTEHTLLTDGVFVQIGSIPKSDFVKKLVDRNDNEEIIIDHRTGKTSCEGMFAAGDVTNSAYKQNNIAAGDAIKAVLSAHQYILKNKKL